TADRDVVVAHVTPSALPLRAASKPNPLAPARHRTGHTRNSGLVGPAPEAPVGGLFRLVHHRSVAVDLPAVLVCSGFVVRDEHEVATRLTRCADVLRNRSIPGPPDGN